MTSQRWNVVIASVLVLGCTFVLTWFLWRSNAETVRREPAERIEQPKQPQQRLLILRLSGDNRLLLFNLDAEGPRNAGANIEAVKNYMIRRYDEELKFMKPEDREKGPTMRVEIHADKDTDRDFIKQVLDACWETGFTNIVVLRKT